MKLTYLGHGGFLIETMGKRLIFDPFISPNELANNVINVAELRADYLFLTHGHGDHIADVEAILANNPDAKLISNYEVVTWYANKGFQGHPMNHGGKWQFDFGTVKYVQAVHSSSFPDGAYAGNPGGFVMSTEEGTFYLAGDTALTLDMKLIPMTCPALDFAIFPLGDNFTMGYEDAIIASDFVECDRIIGCHFDTFGFIKIDHEKVKNAFAQAGKKLLLPEIGVAFEL